MQGPSDSELSVPPHGGAHSKPANIPWGEFLGIDQGQKLAEAALDMGMIWKEKLQEEAVQITCVDTF